MFSTSKITLAALCALGGITLMPAAALAAVTAGTYNTADQGIGFTVIADPNNAGQYLVNGYHWGFTDTCKGGGTTSGGWGTGYSTGQGASIASNGKVMIFNEASLFYMTDAVTFKGNTATGTIITVDPTLTPLDGSTKPKKALACSSKPMKFTATLMSSDTTPLVKNGTMPITKFVYKPQ